MPNNPFQPNQRMYAPFNNNIYAMPMVYGKMVNNENEILPQQIPNDGSMAYFPTSDGTRIYGRAWQADGKIMPVTYVLEQSVQQPQTTVQQMDMQIPQQPVQQAQQQTQPDLAQVLTQVSKSMDLVAEKLTHLEKTLTE